jgi:hypothetical protein
MGCERNTRKPKSTEWCTRSPFGWLVLCS